MATNQRRGGRINAVQRFLYVERNAAFILILAAIAGLVAANSGVADGLRSVIEFRFGPAAAGLQLSVESWINDLLISLFFALVGLELRREFRHGVFVRRGALAVPGLAALLGAAVPAAIFAIVTAGQPEIAAGWAIPMATDLTFALAIFAAFGRGFPPEVRTFLLAFAIIDDVLAIVVIAVFLPHNVEPLWLVGAALLVVAIPAVSRLFPPAIIAVALGAWYCTLESGIHPALAGFAVGFAIPASRFPRLEDRLHPWVGFVVLPVFAFVAAALPLDNGVDWESPLTIAILLRPLGKWLGIVGGVALARLMMPRGGFVGLRMSHVARVATLGGIGFTVAFLVAAGAYGPGSDLAIHANIVTLVAAVVSMAIGAVALRFGQRIREP